MKLTKIFLVSIFFFSMFLFSDAFSSDCGTVYLMDNIYSGGAGGAINPPDSEDFESDPGTVSGDYGKVTMSAPSGSSSRPELYGKELKFKDEKTKYYADEDIKIYAYVKNVGINVPSSITQIRLKLFRFEGEKENGDVREVGDENIKGENLLAGDTKEEQFEFGVPDEEDVYQFYVLVDAENAVLEANEGNNRLGNIRCRVHKRPDIRAKNLTFTDSRVAFEFWEIPEARATFENDGGESFVDVGVEWFLDGLHVASDNMRHWNIEKGEEKHESVKLVNLSVGTHVLQACSDLSADKNGSNNCKSLTFAVLPPPAAGDPPPSPPGISPPQNLRLQ